MGKIELRKLIIRILREGEASGYQIYKGLAAKGIKTWPNHVYTLLAEMDRNGLLEGRWVENPRGNGPRKHLYSLGRKGEAEYSSMLRESIELLMGAFIRSNITLQDLSDHVNSIKGSFSSTGRPASAMRGFRLVMAIPHFDPLVCYPTSFYAWSEAFPNASIYVVKPPAIKFQEGRPNLTFLDGWRHDIPLKDGFADYLLLEGFPKNVSEDETMGECMRVLKDEGHLRIQVSKVMTEEKKPRSVSFPEFVSKLFYDFYGQDRLVSIEHVKRLLLRHFEEVREAEAFGNIIVHAISKRSVGQLKASSQLLHHQHQKRRQE